MKRKAIIIGGGPCGTLTALALQQKGYACEIHEKYKEPYKGGLIALHGGTECLKYLGYFNQYKENISNQIYKNNMLDINGNLLISQNMSPNFISFSPRADLCDYLTNLCKSYPKDIEYHINSRFINYKNNINTNSITAHFEDGTISHGDILIGCDGINSSVRKMFLNDNDVKTYSGFSFWYCMGNMTHDQIQQYKTNDPKGQLCDNAIAVFFPMRKQKKYFLLLGYKASKILHADARIYDEWSIGGNKKELIEFLKKYKASEFFINLGKMCYRVEHLNVHTIKIDNKWHDGRAVIIGDAAHAVPPMGGTGANNAFYDAVCLAHLLGQHQAENDFNYNDIFQKLYDIRSPYTHDNLARTLRLGQIMALSQWMHFFRNTIFKIAAKFGIYKSQMEKFFIPHVGFDMRSKL